jgi:curved DNA-binding protein CbpA
MTREEAFRMLGLEPGAPKERILAEYRRLMKKVHPDVGGTTYLAARLNEAKDILLG